MAEEIYMCWRYNADNPKGQLFKIEGDAEAMAKELAALEKEGWVDSPAKVKKKRGPKSKAEKAAIAAAQAEEEAEE